MLTWASKSTQPKIGTNKQCPGKAKVICVILPTSPTECRLVCGDMASRCVNQNAPICRYNQRHTDGLWWITIRCICPNRCLSITTVYLILIEKFHPVWMLGGCSETLPHSQTPPLFYTPSHLETITLQHIWKHKNRVNCLSNLDKCASMELKCWR